ncbi:MAG: hypothetical protein U1D55_04600 [Phycisphaerae bacterium]
MIALLLVSSLIPAHALAQSHSRHRTRSRPRVTTPATPKEAETPATRPSPDETVAQALRRLAATKPEKLSRENLAWRCGLEFLVAIGPKDTGRISAVLDAVGYQPLPLDGPLPDEPARPLTAQALVEAASRLRMPNFEEYSVGKLELLSAKKLRPEFDAVASWMLEGDVALVVRDAARPGAKAGCVVIRVRGRRATILGGNLLAAFK